MDVRCEKCMTVYEFDDSQVGENGVTVKCTQCGNLFKVKKRITTAEMSLVSGNRTPAWTPPSHPPVEKPPARPTQPGRPAVMAPSIPVPRTPQKTPPPLNPPEPRSTTPPPAHPTATVQAKRTATPARGHSDDELALSTTAPMPSPSFEGPSAMGDALLPSEDPAFASTAPKPRITPPHQSAVSLGLGSMDDFEVPRTRGRLPLLIAGGVAVLALVAVGVMVLRGKGGGDGGRTH